MICMLVLSGSGGVAFMAFHHIRFIDWQIVNAYRLIELDGYVQFSLFLLITHKINLQVGFYASAYWEID
jgi:hypothetical protein